MPCHAMPCHAMPCHAMPCHAMPCHAMPCHAMPCHAMPCHAMPCHAMPCLNITDYLTPYRYQICSSTIYLFILELYLSLYSYTGIHVYHYDQHTLGKYIHMQQLRGDAGRPGSQFIGEIFGISHPTLKMPFLVSLRKYHGYHIL